MKRRPFKIDKKRTPLLATALVIMGGVFSCLLISSPFASDLKYPLAIIVGTLVLLLLTIYCLINPLESRLIQWSEHKKSTLKTYKLKRNRNTPDRPGMQRPATVETIREIKGQL